MSGKPAVHCQSQHNRSVGLESNLGDPKQRCPDNNELPDDPHHANMDFDMNEPIESTSFTVCYSLFLVHIQMYENSDSESTRVG